MGYYAHEGINLFSLSFYDRVLNFFMKIKLEKLL